MISRNYCDLLDKTENWATQKYCMLNSESNVKCLLPPLFSLLYSPQSKKEKQSKKNITHDTNKIASQIIR